jgi:hypothetical protein
MADHCYAECHLCCVTYESFMLRVLLLNVIMLGVVMLSVVMLSVVLLCVIILSVVAATIFFYKYVRIENIRIYFLISFVKYFAILNMK